MLFSNASDCVEGSLQDWVKSIKTETDLIIEYQEDLIAESGNCSDVEEAEVDEMSLDCPKDLKVLPGYLQDTTGSIKPLDIKK